MFGSEIMRKYIDMITSPLSRKKHRDLPPSKGDRGMCLFLNIASTCEIKLLTVFLPLHVLITINYSQNHHETLG